MKKIYLYIICILFINIFSQNVKANYKKKLSANDSISNQEYDKIRKLVIDKQYAQGLKEALDLYDKSKFTNDQNLEFLTSFLIGEIHRLNRNFEKSLFYYKVSINTINKDRNELGELRSFTNSQYARNLLRIGGAFQRLSLNDSAVFYYKKIDKLSSLNQQVLSFKAAAYNNLSGIYQKDSSFNVAIQYTELAIEIYKKENKKISQANANNNLANIYLMQGDFNKSKRIYFDAINLIKKDSSSRAIRVKAKLYYNLAWAMRNLKEHEAYDKLEISYNMENGLRDVETQAMLERVAGEYNVNNFRQEEDLKRQIVINQKQKAQNLSWIIGITSFFIIVLLIFFLNQYKLRQKNLGLELSKQDLLQQQKLEKIRSDSQIRILNATLDGKESERKDIAETLHDSVSALLSSANLHLQACKKQFNGSTPIEVDKSQSIINEASQKIRDLSHTLVSSILLKFGLAFAIKDIAEKYSNSQLQIEVETKYIKRYDQSFEIKLYNIIQEFVNNILKHSNASHASISLIEKNKKLLLTIKDNGDGFDKSLISEKDGLGINQIDARIHMMHGEFNIETSNGKGTTINIELPVCNKVLTKLV